jgi:ribosomal-protein-alanine N-acetyltransferase
MHKLIIRDMREDDIPAVLEIERISFSSPWTEHFFLSEIFKKNAFSQVAVFEERVIGFICVDYMHHESHIIDLAVHPDFRRRGAASVLIYKAREELKKRGCIFVYLKVRASSAGAQEFYKICGFEVEGIRKKYYCDPDEDALLMVVRL